MVETVLTVRNIPFLFGIQQPTLNCRATSDFLAKRTLSRSVVRENGWNIFIPDSFFLPIASALFSSNCLYSFSAFALLRRVVTCPQGFRLLPPPLPTAFRQQTVRSGPIAKQLTLRADSIKHVMRLWGDARSLWKSARAMTGSDPSGTCSHTESCLWNVVHLSIISLNDGICTLESNVEVLVNN